MGTARLRRAGKNSLNLFKGVADIPIGKVFIMRAREGWGKHYSLNYDPFTPQKIVRSKNLRIEPLKFVRDRSDTSRAKLNARAGKKEGGWGEGIFARPRFPPPPNFAFRFAKCAACLQFLFFGVALK